MEVMDISLEQFYKKVHEIHGGFQEDVLSVIAFSVCFSLINGFKTLNNDK